MATAKTTKDCVFQGATTEPELVAMLAKRFAAPAWAFLSQVRNGTGWQRSVRTADALAMGLWPSRGLELHGFEIKVSRSDWRRELKAPEKAEEIARFCHRWWIVVSDEGIVADGELPPAWGLLAPRGGKLVTVQEAPLQEAQAPDHTFLAAILRNASEGSVPRAAFDLQLQKAREEIAEAERKSGERQREHIRRRLEELQAQVTEFEKASGVEIGRSWMVGRIGEAVRAVMEGGVDRQRAELEEMASRMERAALQMRGAVAELAAEGARG